MLPLPIKVQKLFSRRKGSSEWVATKGWMSVQRGDWKQRSGS